MSFATRPIAWHTTLLAVLNRMSTTYVLLHANQSITNLFLGHDPHAVRDLVHQSFELQGRSNGPTWSTSLTFGALTGLHLLSSLPMCIFCIMAVVWDVYVLSCIYRNGAPLSKSVIEDFVALCLGVSHCGRVWRASNLLLVGRRQLQNSSPNTTSLALSPFIYHQQDSAISTLNSRTHTTFPNYDWTTMPSLTSSRHNRPLSPQSISTAVTTPVRAKHLYAVSPSPPDTSYAPTITSLGQQQKINVVTRVAIEGRAKQGQDGASIKMYLKVRYSFLAISITRTNFFRFPYH